jgi:DUF177 domain-containing protein
MSRLDSVGGSVDSGAPAPVVDAWEFARLGQTAEGSLQVADCRRLLPLLSSGDAQAHYVVRGSVDEHGRAMLDLAVDASVELVCQRCLQPFRLPLAARNRLRLIDADPEWSLEEADRAGHEADEVVADAALDLRELVEDELLLALPLSPRHETCKFAGSGNEARRESPFGVLARLRKPAGN